MINLWIIPILLLALLTTFGYFRGKKKNNWISGWIARESENALKPLDTQYTNFGGAIGYNYIYKLEKPFREAKGTFTLLPRHSILYLPISYLISRHDRYYLNLYVQGKLLGEGHIVAQKYRNKARKLIEGIQTMQTAEVFRENKPYLLFWKEKGMEERLRKFIDKVECPDQLLHFCCYGENKNFFFYLRPERERLEEFLKSALPELKRFFVKGAGNDDGSNDKEA